MADILRIKRRSSGGAGPPSALANAELAFNEVDNTLYYGKGGTSSAAASIIPIGGAGLVPTADTAPSSPADGSLWWDSVSGQLFIYYTDVSGSQWVQASNPTAVPSVVLDEMMARIDQLEARIAALEAP